jgi:O-succinylbenzoic acid--CoA ligase
MASNYLNNPALWQSLTSDGWFQTSDLGELINGKLNVLGRADDVINSGGEKISLTAVESLFNTHFPNQAVIAFGLADQEWGERLCIGVTTTLTLAQVQQKMSGKNSPKEIYIFNEIPRSALGKLDRAAAKKLALGN